MARIPRYEGNHDQMHGGHFSGEPINRSHDLVLPTPDHAIGATPSAVARHGLAAHVAPQLPQEQGAHGESSPLPPSALEVMDVVVHFI